ncbi:hypothetical protein HAX54_043890 [Datura stramonium]|uniref:Uncharacterized protein n=1 Tax=Datura stramonium TaxID=4076 RepID=A0ABS8W3T8_DATST|nr:hypothetical protein [Datura stramonium]
MRGKILDEEDPTKSIVNEAALATARVKAYLSDIDLEIIAARSIVDQSIGRYPKLTLEEFAFYEEEELSESSKDDEDENENVDDHNISTSTFLLMKDQQSSSALIL